jgi:predicted  nucleic acid-binding Zn-ribbon protein
MTEPQTLTDNQDEQALNFLRNEIADLKFHLKKKDERIATLDVMLNQIMESHTAEVRAHEDLEDKLKDVIEMLRKRVPHSDILDFLKVRDRNPLWKVSVVKNL